MGFSFRRSKKIGPFRINVSKSGIGVSAGVKGFRVSKGPKGTQIRAGRSGIYYRKNLSDSHDATATEVPSSGHQDARASSTDTAGVARAVVTMIAAILLILVLIALFI